MPKILLVQQFLILARMVALATRRVQELESNVMISITQTHMKKLKLHSSFTNHMGQLLHCMSTISISCGLALFLKTS